MASSDSGSFDHFPEITEALNTAIKELVVKAAHDVEARSKALIRANHQIDTGNMVNGVYTVTASEGSTYPGGATKDLADPAPAPEDEYTAYVGYAAGYSPYQNYGTRFQPARPFVEPAVDEVQASINDALAAIERKLGK